MSVESITLASIVVAGLHRKELGDIEALAASIDELGLLQPIGVTPDRQLLFGRRRLEACRRLGWEELLAVVLPDLGTAVDRLKAERDENVCRKQMTLSELIAVGRRLEEIEEPEAQARKRAGKALASFDAKVGKTDNLVAACLGMSETNYRRAKRVVEAAENEAASEDVRRVAREARERMDATGRVWGSFRKVREASSEPTVTGLAMRLSPRTGLSATGTVTRPTAS